MVRPCCDKMNVKKGILTEEEDAKIVGDVSKHGGNWTSVSKKAGLKGHGKSCKLRCTNHTRPEFGHDNFTPQEAELIIRLHAAIGSRWSIIAQQLPGRTDSDVKNYWNTKLRKKLTEMGIDPVTHKPFSQILADYGNIGGLPKLRTQIGCLDRDLKNTFVFKSERSPIQPEVFSNFRSHLTSSITLAKTEPTQDSLLSSRNNNYTTTYHSLDLLAHLQAITLFTEASNCINNETTQPQFFSEGSSSSSASPSSMSSTSNQVRSSLSFSWRDFLLEDAFLQENSQTQEHDNLVELSPNGSSSYMEYEMQQCVMNTEEMQNLKAAQELEFNTRKYGIDSSSSSKSSFVEAMLDQENENDTFLGFPSLLEEPFYY